MPKDFAEPVEVRVNGTKIGELNSPVDNLRHKIEQENLETTEIQIYDKNQNRLTQKISANKLFQKSDLTQNFTINIKSEAKKEYTINLVF